jgi:molybdopterin synthase sulfur carrier subunit
VQIILKLFASLSEHLPPGRDDRERLGNQVAVEVPEATPVQAVIDSFHLPQALVHLVLVNGSYIAPEKRSRHALREGDALAIWPPVAGG